MNFAPTKIERAMTQRASTSFSLTRQMERAWDATRRSS